MAIPRMGDSAAPSLAWSVLQPFALHHQRHMTPSLLESTLPGLPANLAIVVRVGSVADLPPHHRQLANEPACGDGLRRPTYFLCLGNRLIGPEQDILERRGNVDRVRFDVGRGPLALDREFEVLHRTGCAFFHTVT